MSADTAESTTSERHSVPQSFVLVEAAAGLTAAAGWCLALAWLRLGRGSLAGDAPVALLHQVTVVVGAAALIVVVYFGSGRCYRRSSDRWNRFLAATSTVPAAVAVGGLIALHTGRTDELFRTVAYRQHEVGGAVVTSAAREAWWLACLAVVVVALIAALGYLRDDELSPVKFSWWPWRTAAAALVAAVTAAVLVIPVARSGTRQQEESSAAPTTPVVPHTIRAAEPVAPPPIPSTVDGLVAYRVPGIAPDAKVAAAGPGFAALIDGDASAVGQLIGYDGTTGQQRWSYQLADPKLASWVSSGTGTDSVIVLVTTDAVIGIDATTGKQLWSRRSGRNPDVQVSAAVVLIQESTSDTPLPANERTVLAIQTGQQLWNRSEPDACGSHWLLADAAVVAPVCDPAQPDIAAALLDPTTGHQSGQVLLSALGIDAVELRGHFGDVSLDEALGSTATLQISRVHPDWTRTVAVVDIPSGRLLAMAPPDHNVYLLDALSAVLFGRDPAMILELPTKTLVPTGLQSRGTAQWDIHPQVVRVGAGWATSLSTPAEADKRAGVPSMSPLRVIDGSGVVRALPPMCAPDQGPVLAGLAPGALLVRCGDQVVGVR